MIPPAVHEKLKSIFGLESFRGDQEEIITSALAGHSSLVLMPTGTGKSLCYQMPAVVGKGLVLVISPLIALMHDQVTKLRKLGVRAEAINSAMSKQDRLERLEKLKAGHWQLLYVTPERLRKAEFKEALAEYQKSHTIQLLAVDEAHCISQWGSDFRPDYSRLGEFRASVGNPPVMALTATATPTVQKDILHQLGVPDARVFSGGLERPNLALNVHDVYGQDEKIRGIFALRQQVPGTALVYFSLIQSLHNASRELAKLGVRHLVYHGDLSSSDRHSNQKKFLTEDNHLMLATPAFGLGVDKPDVRLLIHTEISNSVESYFQEVGRAGRDGLLSQCHLFFDPDDVSIQMDFIKWANPDPSFVRKVFQLIVDNPLRVEQEGADFLRTQMNFYNRRDYRVETAMNLLERWGCLEKTHSRLGFKPAVENAGKSLQQIFQENLDENLTDQLVQQRLKVQNEKLLEMVRFSSLKEGCRMSFVLEYFGEFKKSCGICDLCTSPPNAEKG
jgi:ATP-dependent DNA helicase RecQ